MSFLADLAFPGSFVWGEVAATGIQDAEAANAYYSAGGDEGSHSRRSGRGFCLPMEGGPDLRV